MAMLIAKKVVILGSICAVVLFFLGKSDWNLIKKLVGYNVPTLTETPYVSPSLSDANFLKLPAGFSVSVFAKDLENPRVMIFDAKARMVVSETAAGRVVALEDKDKDGKAENKTVLLSGLRFPHGLAFFTNPSTKTTYLYVAEAHQVARYRYDVVAGKILDAKDQNIASFSPDGRHFTRTIALGPNLRKNALLTGNNPVIKGTLSTTKLYISVGSSCDVCMEDSWKRGSILESDPEGTYTAEFAGGLRNAVFFTFHPVTGQIWATEMGRDNLGDDLPPDEINIVESEKKYGWPFCYGQQVRDQTFKVSKIERTDLTDDCSKTAPSHIDIPAHSAPLGLAFVNNHNWPAEWQNDLLVAYHGSWNRSTPTGYKIVRFKLDEKGTYQGVEDFITGWLKTSNQQPVTSNQIYGRPADLKFDGTGNLYITDDKAGVIYKVKPI